MCLATYHAALQPQQQQDLGPQPSQGTTLSGQSRHKPMASRMPVARCPRGRRTPAAVPQQTATVIQCHRRHTGRSSRRSAAQAAARFMWAMLHMRRCSGRRTHPEPNRRKACWRWISTVAQVRLSGFCVVISKPRLVHASVAT